MNTSIIKWIATGDTVAVALLTALASTGVVTGSAAAILGVLIAIGTAIGGFVTKRSIEKQALKHGIGIRA